MGDVNGGFCIGVKWEAWQNTVLNPTWRERLDGLSPIPCALSTDTANLINHLLWTVENIATYSRLVKCKKEIPVRVTGHSGKKTRSNPFARRDGSELQLCDGLQWSDR
jgi:hypothetical protein